MATILEKRRAVFPHVGQKLPAKCLGILRFLRNDRFDKEIQHKTLLYFLSCIFLNFCLIRHQFFNQLVLLRKFQKNF